MANVLGLFGFLVASVVGGLAFVARTGAANVATDKEKRIYEILAVVGLAVAIAIGVAMKVL